MRSVQHIRPRSISIGAVLCLTAVAAQTPFVIDESKIRATLKNDSTVVTIPIQSALKNQTVQASLLVEWLDANDKASGTTRRDVSIAPGQNNINVDLALAANNASIWTRLHYSLSPARADVRAFAPFSGKVALAHIAAHVFELKTSYAGMPRRGSPFTLHAAAIHPVTRRPVLHASWTGILSIDDQKIAPIKTSPTAEGFVELVFNIPNAGEKDPDEDASIEVTAKLGDFSQKASASINVPARMSAHVQSDKPIYQPGQTLHLRAALMDTEGHAAAGAKVVLRVDDQDNERVHTSHLVTSRFGVIADDWPIPDTARLGSYQVTLTDSTDDDYVLATHVIRVSRYELPSFTVMAKPDRPAYLPNQPTRITITTNYLFGKPVPNGKVKIVRERPPVWNLKAGNFGPADQTVSEGEANANGIYVADLHLKADHDDLSDSENRRYQDIHFVAYSTDPGSGRTEQRRFDVRITREAIHVYLIHAGPSSPAYVSTSYADGRPASADVDILLPNRIISLHTNKYGIGKAIAAIPRDTDVVEIKATDSTGQRGIWKQHNWPTGNETLRLVTKRTLHRTGEPVIVQVESPADAPAEQFIIVHAIANDHAVASRIVPLSNHKGEVTFPFQPEFRRTVVFGAWSDSHTTDAVASKAVIFPDSSELNVTMTMGRPEYKPGEKASVLMQVRSADGKPVQAALGLAVVDQAVMERARTDREFGTRPWFYCAFCRNDGETEIGGIRLNDLYHLPSATPISPDLDLAAEALVANVGAFLANNSSEDFSVAPEFRRLTQQMNTLRTQLDRNYAKSFEYPRDLSTFSRVLGREWSGLEDPWGRPFTAEFGLERENILITIRSSGPDKQLGTADDFVAATFRQSYFVPLHHLIERVLQTHEDYPLTLNDFRKLLNENGLLIETLRDAWGTPYRVQVTTSGATRHIQMISAGPDRTFETKDDFTIANFSGSYFRREAREISKAIFSSSQPPRSVEEFERILKTTGIELSQYRDAWNRPYRVLGMVTSRYTDRTNIKTLQVFGGPPQVKTDVTPVTQKLMTFSLRSAGPDGIEDTYDDFEIVRFPVIIKEESASAQDTIAKAVVPLKGTGAITGQVVDLSGGAIANATVTLIDVAQKSYETASQPDGGFSFVSVPPGLYAIHAHAPGFSSYEVSQIPVTDGKPTTVNVVLNLGSTSETVTVEASALPLQTNAAQLSIVRPASTPRVREYFPETLVWLPELITDARGVASTQFTLADTVTTWKLAAFASTLDGRIAEVDGDLRAFQPFFLDFNPPPVLTDGDQIELPVTIRNYLDQAQKVKIGMEPNGWSTVQGAATRQAAVAANSSANVSFVIQTNHSADKALHKITASAGRQSDVIQKTSRVHPDGQEVTQNFADLIISPATFGVSIPQTAIASATRAELRLYPNISSLLLESASAILETPHGCAEQTISAGYANLVAWRFAKAAGIVNARIEAVALSNVIRAVEALSGFREPGGGIRYWGSGNPDTAVTAYALAFLIEASSVANVEQDDLIDLVKWLERRQAMDGTWLRSSRDSSRQTPLLTSLVARSLAAAKNAGIAVQAHTLAGAYHHLAQFTDQNDEPYMLAQFMLAAMDSADEALLKDTANRLAGLSRDERGGAYWDLRTNSPFYGWGTAGRYETTGLVVSALSTWRARHNESTALDPIIRRGLVFLLRGRDSMGGWYSTQSTLRTMRAVADAYSAFGVASGHGGNIEVRINGRLVKSVSMPTDPQSIDPIPVDLSSFLAPGENRIEMVPTGGGSTLMRFASTHWLPWSKTSPRTSPELRFSVQFDKLNAPAGELVRCSVKAERIGFRGYGMMLAEIGLPPGAEVDRASLESVIKGGTRGVDRYEILPDRVILYLWPAAGGASLDFYLRARMPMTAKSAVSILYDYYNPEAMSEVAPLQWRVP